MRRIDLLKEDLAERSSAREVNERMSEIGLFEAIYSASGMVVRRAACFSSTKLLPKAEA